MKKKSGQGLSAEMKYLLEFGTRYACDLCCVEVFVRRSVLVEGVIPRHQRLRRVVPERRFSGRGPIWCCRRCCAYLDALKKERFEQERQKRLQLERERDEYVRNKRVLLVVRLDCVDVSGTKAALQERYGDRVVKMEEVSPAVLRVELIVLGWWSWRPVEDGGDQFFFEQVLRGQGLILAFQKFPFPIDDRGDLRA